MHILRLLSLFILLLSLSSFTESTNIKENIATKATATVATTLTNKGNPKKTYSPPKKKNSKTVASKKNNKIAQKRKVAVRHNAKRKTVASAKRRKATKKTITPTQYAENTAKAEDIQDDLEDDELLEEEEEDENIDIALTALSESKADTQQQKILLDTAFSYLGTPYRHGGITRKGMDCSGFVSTAFKSIEIPLSRSSQEMATQGKKIKLSNVQVGDLLFFKTLRKNRISHVGLVVDVDGGEVKFIHASSKRGVVISSLSDAYYKKAFRIAKRVM
ncbi:C40 family peptidase [Capnocytophaga leadbetteri]|uniref:C40 family peptidase n=1 Tax=Capnocytophaga leadbetteri TaxID=327575 RepID=UPI0026E94EA0|nr:C40 family peptidase [Capnocytophaga leadbetteri]